MHNFSRLHWENPLLRTEAYLRGQHAVHQQGDRGSQRQSHGGETPTTQPHQVPPQLFTSQILHKNQSELMVQQAATQLTIKSWLILND